MCRVSQLSFNRMCNHQIHEHIVTRLLAVACFIFGEDLAVRLVVVCALLILLKTSTQGNLREFVASIANVPKAAHLHCYGRIASGV